MHIEEVNRENLYKALEALKSLKYVFIKEISNFQWLVIIKEVEKNGNLLYVRVNTYKIIICHSGKFYFDGKNSIFHLINPYTFFEKDCICQMCLQDYIFTKKSLVSSKLSFMEECLILKKLQEIYRL
jgi:hypothetical protein